eukprot:scaffold6975_cov83-Skeletonema_menzelii.AAC.1
MQPPQIVTLQQACQDNSGTYNMGSYSISSTPCHGAGRAALASIALDQGSIRYQCFVTICGKVGAGVGGGVGATGAGVGLGVGGFVGIGEGGFEGGA